MRRSWMAAATAAMVLVGCGDDGAESSGSVDAVGVGVDHEAGFVGRLDGTEAFVAVVTEGDAVEVYTCDGASGIAARLTGTVDDPTSFTLTNEAGDEATVEFADGAYTGEVTLAGGSTHEFATESAVGDAGLFHLVDAPDEVSAGWIVLNDGSQRGSILFAGGGSLQVVNAPPIAGTGGDVSLSQLRALQEATQMQSLRFGRARP